MSENLEAELERVIGAGVRYILEHQLASGCWVDWELPPGQCLMWTTAYIGYKLSGLPENLLKETLFARKKAAQWLLVNELPGHGWGYNGTVGVDADSTAHAILFLSSVGTGLPEGSYRRLEAFQSEDGGFSTYQRCDSYGSWCVSHPEVTSMAILALLTRAECSQQTMAINRGVDYIVEQRTQSGLWNSFWWETPLYGTNTCLALLNAVDCMKNCANTRENLLLTAPNNEFEAALLLSASMRVTADIEASLALPVASALARRLISTQRLDGSWNAVPILRVTRRDCYKPWCEADAGALYADQNRLFTSVSVVDALAQFWCSRWDGKL
ncbi:MAG: prenyltransferase/squalene oxidase repeat-containing protein [Nitrosospira sp.]